MSLEIHGKICNHIQKCCYGSNHVSIILLVFLTQVYNTPGGHVTRDYREGVAQLSDLRFKLFDTAGMETSVQSGSLLERARGLTAKLLSRSHLALFMVDARAGVSITLSQNECELFQNKVCEYCQE